MGFSLERVLRQLSTQAGAPTPDPLGLFQQLWDTQNLSPGHLSDGPHCDSHLTVDGYPGLGDHPWECPRHEGYQAGIDPFGPNPLYAPVGVFNRFDLAPLDGSHCGEYRIVFAMQGGHPLSLGLGRNYIIFEAVLPNPTPELGLAGCFPVAEFWASLGGPPAQDAAELETFFFSGIPGFAPVVHVDHYGLTLGADGSACSTGQIRTNQFTQDPWVLREFKLVRDCRCGPCDLRVLPMTVHTNPAPRLFEEGFWLAGPEFYDAFASQVESLSADDPNEITWSVPDILNAPESRADPSDDYAALAAWNQPLLDEIQGALPPGSPLPPHHIVERALTQSCAGCHFLSDGRDLGGGVTWPNSLVFVHIEDFPDANGVYALSPALHEVFLPYRNARFIEFYEDPTRYPGPGSSCELAAPPVFELSALECAAPTGTLRTPHPREAELARELRREWEGGRLLGRSSGH